jgi:hypothetical protein
MEMIKRDSEKHKIMQQFAIDNLTKEAFHLTPKELIPLGEVLEKHIQAEARSMGLANSAITMSRDYFTNFIVSYLMADEIKHHEMLTKLDHIKGQVHPAGVLRGARQELPSRKLLGRKDLLRQVTWHGSGRASSVLLIPT